MKRLTRHTIAAATALLAAGCAVGPDYSRPQLPETQGYAQTPLPAATAGQRFAAGLDIQADWWTLFRSPQLNALIDKALAISSLKDDGWWAAPRFASAMPCSW